MCLPCQDISIISNILLKWALVNSTYFYSKYLELEARLTYIKLILKRINLGLLFLPVRIWIKLWPVLKIETLTAIAYFGSTNQSHIIICGGLGLRARFERHTIFFYIKQDDEHGSNAIDQRLNCMECYRQRMTCNISKPLI